MGTDQSSLTVSIAMCTYNGERFLRKQLDSIAAQTRLSNEGRGREKRSNDPMEERLAQIGWDVRWGKALVEMRRWHRHAQHLIMLSYKHFSEYPQSIYRNANVPIAGSRVNNTLFCVYDHKRCATTKQNAGGFQ